MPSPGFSAFDVSISLSVMNLEFHSFTVSHPNAKKEILSDKPICGISVELELESIILTKPKTPTQ
jgi:hypothetical protein